MTRRNFAGLLIRALLIVGCGLTSTACVGAQSVTTVPDSERQSRKPPNIVVILADDLGYGDVGAYGAQRIRTPNIDDLARRGLRFRQGYASANVCTPSRAGLMTGRFAIRSGLAWKVVTAGDSHGLPEAEETLAELTKRRGYRTLLVGKWHLGDLGAFSPLDHGFDHFFGVPHSNDMPNFALFDGRELVEQPVDQRTLTRRYTQRAVEFIEQNADGPFLLFVSHTFPHIPLFASDRFRGKSDAGIYGDTVEELDWSTGEIVAALSDSGIVGNTLIVFTSDNGPFFEGSTAGLKGAKGGTWEGGYRVPLIMTWPEVVEAGRVSDALAMNIDLLPTVADLLDLEPAAKAIDGVSLSAVLNGAERAPREYLYFFNNERVVGVRSTEWKLVTHAYYTGSLGAFEKFDQLPGFETAYEMLLDADGVEGESYNYADRQPDALSDHRKALEEARREFSSLRTRALESTYPE